jgi:hypothetical protein
MSRINSPKATEEMLQKLQQETFDYFLYQADEHTGLIADKTQPGSVASIAAVGMGLSCYITGVERGYMSRTDAVNRTRKVLEFLLNSPQGTEPDATGYKGFYYHFLDMQTGRRAWESELSTMDTAIFLAGVLTAQCYFTGKNKVEQDIRRIAAELYLRVDWQWALNGRKTISHGWKPETGFFRHHWNKGYSEALLLYILALGSPTFPIAASGYKKWTSTFEWIKAYDIEYLYAGPLFIHHMSHVWIDFKGIRDDVNKKTGIDYFENSRRATLIHQRYAIDNPKNYAGYCKHCWGLTACDGPGPRTQGTGDLKRYYYNYKARGAPFGPDDGTVAPWAVVASLPFAPKIVLSTTRYEMKKGGTGKYYHHGFYASFNPTYKGKNNAYPMGWISQWQYAINQGPVILMIENYRTGLTWNIMKNCPYIVEGLRKAGFTGGWLNKI